MNPERIPSPTPLGQASRLTFLGKYHFGVFKLAQRSYLMVQSYLMVPTFVKGLVGSDLDGQDGGPSVSSCVWPCAQWSQFTSQWRTVLYVSVETITNNRMSSTGSPIVASKCSGAKARCRRGAARASRDDNEDRDEQYASGQTTDECRVTRSTADDAVEI